MPGTLTLASQTTLRKVARHTVAPLFVAYILAYLDRVNVGFAKLQMLRELHFSETIYGLGAGIFFIGYFLFGMPANLVLHRVGARRWLATLMIVWGLVSAATMIVRTPLEFYGIRFLLGLAEAGFFPGAIFYLTEWFPENRRARVTAGFMSAVAICGALGSPLSGWIMERFDARASLEGWQWLFLLEAVPALLMGIYLFFRLADAPADASWLDREEKRALAGALALDSRSNPPRLAHTDLRVADVLLDPRVWLVSLIYFCAVTGLYGISFWLPTLIAELGIRRPATIGLLAAIPYAAAAVGMILVGRSADRRHEYRWHVAGPAALGALGLILSVGLTANFILAMGALTLATWGLLTAPPLIWSIPTGHLRGAPAAVGIGLINSCGNLAGFASPYAVGWIKDLSGSTDAGMYLIAAVVLCGAGLVLLKCPAR